MPIQKGFSATNPYVCFFGSFLVTALDILLITHSHEKKARTSSGGET